jgi:4-diphosphocytidyl-2-C-methyl-D-erythritol kinase
MIALMSGLGGSATDTASIIKWITNKYHFQLSPLHLKYIALHIGSDIPFFLSGYKTAWVSGYGDEVIEYKKPIPKFNIILTNIKMDTTKVYQSMNKNYVSQVNVRHACKHLNRNSFCKDTIYNDMWVFAKKINRRLANLSNRLAKSKNIILSGSGGSLVEIC